MPPFTCLTSLKARTHAVIGTRVLAITNFLGSSWVGEMAHYIHPHFEENGFACGQDTWTSPGQVRDPVCLRLQCSAISSCSEARVSLVAICRCHIGRRSFSFVLLDAPPDRRSPPSGALLSCSIFITCAIAVAAMRPLPRSVQNATDPWSKSKRVGLHSICRTRSSECFRIPRSFLPEWVSEEIFLDWNGNTNSLSIMPYREAWSCPR